MQLTEIQGQYGINYALTTTATGGFGTENDSFSSFGTGAREIYKQESQKLPFGTGYRWRKGQSNLIVAEQLKKGKAPRATLVVKKVIPKKEKKKTAQISKGKSLDLNLRLIAKSVITKEYMNDKNNALVLNECTYFIFEHFRENKYFLFC